VSVTFVYCVETSDVLKARPWPRGTSRPNFMALASKVQALALASGPVASEVLGPDLQIILRQS